MKYFSTLTKRLQHSLKQLNSNTRDWLRLLFMGITCLIATLTFFKAPSSPPPIKVQETRSDTTSNVFTNPDAVHVLIIPFYNLAEPKHQLTSYHTLLLKWLGKITHEEGVLIETLVISREQIPDDITLYNFEKLGSAFNADIVIGGAFEYYAGRPAILIDVQYSVIKSGVYTTLGDTAFNIPIQDMQENITRGIGSNNIKDAVYIIAANALYVDLQYEKALKVLEKVHLSPVSKFAYAYKLSGFLNLSINRHDKAYEMLCIAAKFYPDDIFILNNMAIAARKSGKYQRSVNIMDSVLSSAPKYQHGYTTRGNAYYAMKKYRSALDDYYTALRLDPKDSITRFNLTSTFAELEYYDRAAMNYQTLLIDNPYDYLIYNDIAEIYFNNHKYHNALDIIERALKLAPNNEDCLCFKSKTLLAIANEMNNKADSLRYIAKRT